jgi:hypothetical protein
MANICGMIVIRRGLSRAQRRNRLWGNILAFRDIMIHGARPELIAHIYMRIGLARWEYKA